jgi:hypothetical protein
MSTNTRHPIEESAGMWSSNSTKHTPLRSPPTAPSSPKGDARPATTDGPVTIKDVREIPLPLPRPSRSNISKLKPQQLQNQQQLCPLPPPSPTLEVTDDGNTEISDTDGPSIPGNYVHKNTEDKPPSIKIPKIPPISSSISLPTDLERLASGLEGKFVDEFGNVLDWNGHVLGRVEGDLPSMIGRSVSTSGEVIGEGGEVVGYVSENFTLAHEPPSPQPLQDMTGGGMKVDHMGNILDSHGNYVGHFNSEALAEAEIAHQKSNSTRHDQQIGGGCHTCRHNNKPSPTPNPSDVYLDIKSTSDGIQLIIKIPTIFNSDNKNIREGFPIRIG